MFDVWVLGSGSGGNATLVATEDGALLIDAGFSADQLEARMAGTGIALSDVHTVVLTHGHSDHIKFRFLKQLRERRGRFLCHEQHRGYLRMRPMFRRLDDEGLVECYDEAPVRLTEALALQPVPLSHDFYPTFGFVLDYSRGSRRARAAYLADLGACDRRLVETIGRTDLLAIEFNHDEQMERTSGRPWDLIRRVLGPEGHLSNAQAGDLLGKVMDRQGEAPRFLVALHRSLDCNRPDLVDGAIREQLDARGRQAEAIQAQQDRPTPRIRVCD